MRWSGADRAVPANGQSPPRRWRVCVLGDAHLDLVISLDGQLAIDTDTPARTRLSAGGQAANVAAWVAALGGRSTLIAARATDLAASLVSAELASRGVELAGPVIDGSTGVVVALARISVDLSSVAAIASFGVAEFRALLADVGPDLVFGNRAETELVGELAGVRVIRKLGADGVMVGGQHHPALRAEAVDATGAGDAFAAGYLVGGIDLALKVAARAVAKMGAMP